jgi:hypothetical protein
MNSIEFASSLAQGIYKLEFSKLDGSLRKMRATRMSAYIPMDMAPKNDRQITEEMTAVPVFDLDLQEWRSVRPTNVLSMESV